MITTANPAQPAFRIGILLLDGFNALAMHAFVDPFRCANYLRSMNLYEWVFLGLDGTTARASNGFRMVRDGIPPLSGHHVETT